MSTTRKPLLRAKGTALHRQIFLVLRDQMIRRQYAPGEPLPTEETLCHDFGVSRITVRRALLDLETEGLVERQQGRGTFVRETHDPEVCGQPVTLLDGLRKIALETRVEVLDVTTRRAPLMIASLLRLPPDGQAVYTLRLRRSGSIPLMMTEAWLPMRFSEAVTAAALKKKALFELLLGAGVTFGRVNQELSAEAADPPTASLLDTAISAPIIRITRVLHDAAGAPVQHLTARLTPERSRVVMDIPASEVDTLSAGYVAHDVSPSLHARRRADGRR